MNESEILSGAAKNGLVGLAILSLQRMSRDEALKLLDAVADGRASLGFVVEVSGPHMTVTATLTHQGGVMDLFSLDRAEATANGVH